MTVSAKGDAELHHKLPIDADENILSVYRHHWYAYASIWLAAGFIALIFVGVAISMVSLGDKEIDDYRRAILAGGAVLAALVLLSALVPTYLRKQEQLVLTNEALLQVLQPTIFASKVDQVSLMRVDDISVRQGFLGTVLGFGHLTIETPGEQDNYEFKILPNPSLASREITNAREKYEVAVRSGKMAPKGGWENTSYQNVPGPKIDPAEYQRFIEFEKWQSKHHTPSQSNGRRPKPTA